MGVEKERSDTHVIMNEDEFNRSIESIRLKKEAYVAAPNRDPNYINAHLKVGFEDVIAEPVFTHSFDRVWIGSHPAFELLKFSLYRLLTVFLALPVAFILGLLYAALSLLHIWLVMPSVQSFMILQHSVQKVWRSLTDMFITPLFHRTGKFSSSVQIQITEN